MTIIGAMAISGGHHGNKIWESIKISEVGAYACPTKASRANVDSEFGRQI